MFGGYPRYKYESWIGSWLRLPAARSAAGLLSAIYPSTWRGRLQLEKMTYPEGRRYAEQVSIFDSAIRESLYRERGPRAGAEEFIARHYLPNAGNARWDPLSRLQQVDLLYGWLPGDMLTKVDMASMRVSLELRCPLLDQRIVEYMSQVPTRYKLRGNTTKYLLKKIGERLVPREVLYRPKQGFSLPLTHWFRHELRSYVDSMLLGPESRLAVLFRREMLMQLVNDHNQGRWDHSGRIFSLLALEIWLRGKTADVPEAENWIRQSSLAGIEDALAHTPFSTLGAISCP